MEKLSPPQISAVDALHDAYPGWFRSGGLYRSATMRSLVKKGYARHRDRNGQREYRITALGLETFFVRARR